LLTLARCPPPSLRSRTTHIQNGNFDETELGAIDATLSSAAVTRLQVPSAKRMMGLDAALVAAFQELIILD
jgi:hypothetical protein